MKLFENKVGRPTNEILKKRKIFYFSALTAIIFAVGAVTLAVTGISLKNLKGAAAIEINYNLNGVSSSTFIGPTSCSKASNCRVASTEPSNNYYNFAGWNTKKDGTGTKYSVREAYTGKSTTLYAIWQGKVPSNIGTELYNIGIKEDPKSYRKYGPWCSIFAKTLYEKAGIITESQVDSLTTNPGGKYTYTKIAAGYWIFMDKGAHYNGYLADGNHKGNLNYVPVAGDLILYVNGAHDDSGHVGVVTSVDTKNNQIHTIEGNVSNTIMPITSTLYKPTKKGYGNVLGYFSIRSYVSKYGMANHRVPVPVSGNYSSTSSSSTSTVVTTKAANKTSTLTPTCSIPYSVKKCNGKADLTVQKAQELLHKLGYLNDTIDGIYGNNTKNAVVKFQKANKLLQDGVLGKLTMATLAKKTNTPYFMIKFDKRGGTGNLDNTDNNIMVVFNNYTQYLPTTKLKKAKMVHVGYTVKMNINGTNYTNGCLSPKCTSGATRIKMGTKNLSQFMYTPGSGLSNTTSINGQTITMEAKYCATGYRYDKNLSKCVK